MPRAIHKAVSQGGRHVSPLARVGSWGINRPDGRRTAPSASNKQELDIFVVRSDGEQLVFPDEVHDFLRHAHWVRAYKATADFFQRKLG